MTESEKAKGGTPERHPIMRLILENPISALNTAAIIFGGGMVWASNNSRMTAMEDRIQKIEVSIRDDKAAATIKEDRTTLRIEAQIRDLNDVKVTVRGIDAAVQFLVRQAQGAARQ